MATLDLRHLLKSPSKKESLGPSGGQDALPLVLACGRGFMCGLCRTHFQARTDATRCARRCLLDHVCAEPMRPLVCESQSKHRCELCHRIYSNRKDAAFCFSNCLESREGLLPPGLLEQLRTSLSLALTPRAKTVAPLEKMKSQIKVPSFLKSNSASSQASPPEQRNLEGHEIRRNSQAPREEVKIRERDTHLKTITENRFDTNQALQTNPAQASQVSGSAKKIFRKTGQKPFLRADARYVCSACNQKFFTKSEVEACFLEHPVKD